VLPAKNRLRTSKDFALTTKTGVRATSLSLVVYLKTNSTNSLNETNAGNSSAPLVGLIVNKSVGGSVVRHRVSRQLRHLASTYISNIPAGSRLVIRVLRNQPNYEVELKELMAKVLNKIPVNL
jgi:ribonuclease P protein component